MFFFVRKFRLNFFLSRNFIFFLSIFLKFSMLIFKYTLVAAVGAVLIKGWVGTFEKQRDESVLHWSCTAVCVAVSNECDISKIHVSLLRLGGILGLLLSLFLTVTSLCLFLGPTSCF